MPENGFSLDPDPNEESAADSECDMNAAARWYADAMNHTEKHKYAFAQVSLSFKDITFAVNDAKEQGLVQDTKGDQTGQGKASVLLSKQPKNFLGKNKIKKIILDGCNSHIGEGKLVALMGPSGSGKTTLLDIISQKKKSFYEGVVLLNGRKLDTMFDRIISYVPQHDAIYQHWTVSQAVTFNALLATPTMETRMGLKSHVHSILESIGLATVADTKIGGPQVRGISGGQRRRVGLARAIAQKACLMFCDEPTSGLSSTDAELLLRMLRGISLRWNTTTVVVIHQPRREATYAFDQLILLTSRPGRVVYDGKMQSVLPYLEDNGYSMPNPNINPTDFFLDLVTPGSQKGDPDSFIKLYKALQYPRIKEAIDASIAAPGKTIMNLLAAERDLLLEDGYRLKLRRSIYGVSYWRQAVIIGKRKLMLIFLDKGQLFAAVTMKCVTGLISGLLFLGVGYQSPRGSAQATCFMVAAHLAGLLAINNLAIFDEERSIMKYEADDKLYSPVVFFFVGSAVDIMFNAAVAAICLSIIFVAAGLPMENIPLASMCLPIVGQGVEAFLYSLGAYCSSAGTSILVGNTLGNLLSCFSGVLVSPLTCPRYLEWYLSISPFYHMVLIQADIFYGDDSEAWANLNYRFGLERPNYRVIAIVISSWFVIFRSLQLHFLINRHNVVH